MHALDQAKQLFLEGLKLLETEQLELAESKLAKAHLLVPDRLSILVNLSAVQIKLQSFEQAKLTAERALALDSTHADAWLNLGIAEKGLGSYTRSVHCLNQALHFDPASAAAWVHKGWVHIAQKQARDAQVCFDQAAQINPGFVTTWQAEACISLGALFYKTQQIEQAVAPYRQALHSAEHKVLALQSLVILYSELKYHKELTELINEHDATIGKDALCNELLGFYHFNADRLDLAHQHFRQAALLSEHQPNTNNPQEWPVSKPRLRHDFEQLSLLKERGLHNSSTQAALEVITRSLQAYREHDHAALIQAIGAYHYLPDTPFTGNALGPNDFQKIEHDFMHKEPKLVVIDNFLSDAALLELRKFCEEATVWKRSYPNGYLGSFMASGFCSPVILEIARQLKMAMPNVVGTQDLRQAWGFKYDQGMKGINLHADFARVNINFWLTPDDACLDPSKGGILVYDTPPPADWSFEKANADSETIQRYLELKQSKVIRVPYKMNRCVLFDSTYFHTTDEIHFKAGYENRRINCTLLFGKGL